MNQRAGTLMAFAAAAAVGMAASSSALAADRTFIGGAGATSWSIPGNWSPSGTPQQNDSAFLLPSDASNRTVIYNGAGSLIFGYGTVALGSSGAGSIIL